jgi:hypothetical protein
MNNKDIVIQDIKDLTKYNIGWFESYSLPASKQAIEDAIDFIEKIQNLNKLPHVSLADDGEVNFFWDHGDVRIDLGFYGDCTYSCYVKSDHGEFVEDGISLYMDIPSYITINI